MIIFRPSNTKKLVKFTDHSQIHEIPPKPKRTKPVEKRSRSAPNLDDLKKSSSGKTTSEVKIVQAVEQGQRVSMTSLEDLKKYDSTDNTKKLNTREKDDLNKVKNTMINKNYCFNNAMIAWNLVQLVTEFVIRTETGEIAKIMPEHFFRIFFWLMTLVILYSFFTKIMAEVFTSTQGSCS